MLINTMCYLKSHFLPQNQIPSTSNYVKTVVSIGTKGDESIPFEDKVIKLEKEKDALLDANRKMMSFMGPVIVASDDSTLSSDEENFQPVINTRNYQTDPEFAKLYPFLCNV